MTAQGKTDFDEVSVKVGTPNIALLKPATASSSEGSSTPPSAVNDGNLNTRWSSAFSDPQWIWIDLQEVYDLTGARIYWEASAAKSYEVQISQNGSDWIRAYYTSSGDGGIDDISFQASARYVRMYSHSRVSQYGNSIWEFELFGTIRTGIESTQAGGSFSVYPNPAAGGAINLSFGREWAGEDIILSISSFSGQLICSDRIRVLNEGAGAIVFPLNETIRPGIYILTVSGRGGIKQTKLIIN